VGAIVINSTRVNHVDTSAFKAALAKTQGRLITVEDHQLIGGFGQMLCHALLMADVEFKVKSLAVRGEFGQSSYTALELYKKHKIDASAIVEASISY
jgi:transketolase